MTPEFVGTEPINVNGPAIRDLFDAAHWLAQHPELPPVLLVELSFHATPGPDGDGVRGEMKAVASAMREPVEAYSPLPCGRLGRVVVRDEIGETVKITADAYGDDLGVEQLGPFYRAILSDTQTAWRDED